MEMDLASKKPKMDQAKNVIKASLTDFKEIATKFPNMLVDKTELIYIFCTSGEKHELITAPPRFGKSVNLTMFRCFFEIEVDSITGKKKTQFDPKTQAVTDTKNYRLFTDRKLDIMKHSELVKEHFGRHPVLYVCFKVDDVIIKTVDDAIEFCRTVVQASFRQHKYLCVSKKLTDDDREFCNNWCSDKTYSKMNPSGALKRLAELLYQHFERDIVFLVDEYDSLVAKALVEGDGKSVEDVCRLRGVNPSVASELLEEYDDWMKQINQKHKITSVLVKELINASQQTREEICSMNGIEVDVAQRLVDEYEQQMTESWSISNLSSVIARRLIRAHENNIVEICKKPVYMIASLLKTDDKNIHLLGSLVTGVSYIAGIGWSGAVNNITPCRFTEHHSYNRFYGFTSEEIELLLKKLEESSALQMDKEETLAIIKAQYNGYEYPGLEGESGKKIHCPWSVLKFLKKGEPKSYWIGSAYTEPLKNMFHNSEVKAFLINLLDEGTDKLSVVDKLTADDLIVLKKHMNGTVAEGSHLLFLNFILELGYLTVNSTQLQTQGYCFVKIPNHEIRMMILTKLREYYSTQCSEDYKQNAITKCKDMLTHIDLASNPDVSDENFEEALRVFKQELQTLFQQYSGCLLKVNESGFHCFMAYVISTAKGYSFLTEHFVRTTDLRIVRLDILGIKASFAFLAELSNLSSSKKSADADLKQILNNEYFNVFEQFKALSGIKRHILMGICVNDDKKISIAAIRNHKKGETSYRIDIPFDA